MTHQDAPDLDTLFSAGFWDDRYRDSEHVWSGRVSVPLVRHVAGLQPGRALELGCGEGADALWLAEQGWDVLAADLSQVAIDKAARATAGRPAAERITWQQVDARTWQPPADAFELVSMQYIHLPTDAQRELLRRLEAAVVPGGRVLISAHDPKEVDEGIPRWHIRELLHTPAEIAALHDDQAWTIEFADTVERTGPGPDGAELTMWDSVVVAVRRG